MKMVRRSPVAAFLLALVLAASTAAAQAPAAVQAWPLPAAAPESQGMSSERLARLHAGVQRFVDEGRHAGAVSLIARNGRIVDWRTYGKRDLENDLPMEKDTICRIYSMSKIVTSVAVLSLLEEARFQLDDPVADTLPELGRMKVLTGGTPEKPLLADAKTPITIRHLLTHTSGLTYDFGDGTIDKIFRQVKPFDASSLGGVRGTRLSPPARPRAGRALHLRRFDGHPGRAGREAVGPHAGGVPRRADLPAPGDEGHGLRRSGREEGQAREGVRARPRRQAPAGEVAPRAGAGPPAEAPQRRRGPSSRRPATTPASCRCS